MNALEVKEKADVAEICGSRELESLHMVENGNGCDKQAIAGDRKVPRIPHD
jgi:hypothetical protein